MESSSWPSSSSTPVGRRIEDEEEDEDEPNASRDRGVTEFQGICQNSPDFSA